MGKRIELPVVFRPGAKLPPDKVVPPAPAAPGVVAAAAIAGVIRDQVEGAHAQVIEDAIVALARKRALKAAQMKRYRARKRPK